MEMKGSGNRVQMNSAVQLKEPWEGTCVEHGTKTLGTQDPGDPGGPLGDPGGPLGWTPRGPRWTPRGPYWFSSESMKGRVAPEPFGSGGLVLRGELCSTFPTV